MTPLSISSETGSQLGFSDQQHQNCIKSVFKNANFNQWSKMAAWEDPELTSFQGHTKTTKTYGMIPDEKELGTCTRERGDVSKNVWLWKPMGLTSRVSRELWRAEILLLRDSCAYSLVPGSSVKMAI